MPLCRYLVLLIRSIHEEGYAMRHIIVRDKPKANRSVFAGGTREWISLHRADRAGPEYEYPSRRRRGQQTERVLESLKAILTHAGLTLSQVHPH
jgi:hypothetical protein